MKELPPIENEPGFHLYNVDEGWEWHLEDADGNTLLASIRFPTFERCHEDARRWEAAAAGGIWKPLRAGWERMQD